MTTLRQQRTQAIQARRAVFRREQEALRNMVDRKPVPSPAVKVLPAQPITDPYEARDIKLAADLVGLGSKIKVVLK